MKTQLKAVLLFGVRTTWSLNFPYEEAQLSAEDVAAFPAIAFGDASKPVPLGRPTCKILPEDDEWPPQAEWDRLNSTLGGALLHPEIPAAACYRDGPQYDSARCRWLLTNATAGRFYIDDPITVLTRWPQGDTCPIARQPTGTCTRGGYPYYVVNVTSVRQVQAAVNFARNRNIRLIVKNTGHDFVGKSSGRGSLSLWTHHLKSFDFIPSFNITDNGGTSLYSGMAARVGAGLESWEMYSHMRRHNISLAVPGDSTVGAYGGWLAGGGHHNLASYFGLGSDQALSLQVVAADGRFVTADHETNTDLFYALRGGGPSTYGVVTSAIVKAHPPLQVVQSPLRFSTALVNSTNATTAAARAEVFWAGVTASYRFSKQATAAGGTVYDYIRPMGSGNSSSFSFSADFELPDFSAEKARAFVQPLYDELNGLGIAAVNPIAVPSPRSSDASQGKGDVVPGNSRFTSRLFPRANWDNMTVFDATMAAIRRPVQAGYTFHGIHLWPKPSVAGWPGTDSGVNPAFRTAQMHADLFDRAAPGVTPQRWLETWRALNRYMQAIREVTREGGAYVNEADRLEPHWQRSFWGSNYRRLLAIKRARDPWGLFYAPTTPGSELWEVRTADGLPTQNGPLCRRND